MRKQTRQTLDPHGPIVSFNAARWEPTHGCSMPGLDPGGNVATCSLLAAPLCALLVAADGCPVG